MAQNMVLLPVRGGDGACTEVSKAAAPETKGGQWGGDPGPISVCFHAIPVRDSVKPAL